MSFNLVEGMKGVMLIIVGALLIVGILFVGAILGALIGAVVGFVVSVTPWLGAAVIAGFATLGITGVNLVQVGAALGFIGGFFKSVQYNNKS